MSQLLTPPHSEHAEQAVLGAILTNNELLDDVLEVIKVEDFYNRGHREIFQAIEKLVKSKKPADVVTLSNQPQFDLSYCTQLVRNCPSSRNAVVYAQTIKRNSIQRKLIAAANEIAEDAFSKCDNELELVGNAERKLASVTELLTIETKDSSAKAIAKQSYERMREAVEAGSKMRGISTGIPELDKITNGLKPSTMILLAARPGKGKTTFAMNIVEAEAIAGGYPLVFSIEMSAADLMDKVISSNGNVPISAIGQPTQLDDYQWAGIGKAMKRIAATNLEIIDNGSIITDEIRLECRRYLRKHGKLTLIMIDYVQLIRGKKSDNRTTQVDEVSRDLKALAKEFECPVLVLSQLSRDIEKRADKTPMNSDLRESGQLEQDAQEIMFIHNDYNPDKESPNDGLAKILVTKIRMGRMGNVVTEFNGAYSRFEPTNRVWVDSSRKGKSFQEKFGG